MERRRIGIIGLGVIGSLLLAGFQRRGFTCYALETNEQRMHNLNSLTIQSPHSVIPIHPPSFLTSDETLFFQYPFDYLWITTKAPILHHHASHWLNSVDPSTSVIIPQNGLLFHTPLKRLLDLPKCYRWIVNFGGYFKNPTTLIFSYAFPPNYLGQPGATHPQLNATRQAILEILSDAHLQTNWTESIDKAEWEKALLNAAVSPVAALHSCSIREILTDPSLFHLFSSLLEEGIQLARLYNIEIADTFQEHALDYLHSLQDHRPSMVTDVQQAVPTELAYLNGLFCELGQSMQLPMSTHRWISHALEKTILLTAKE